MPAEVQLLLSRIAVLKRQHDVRISRLHAPQANFGDTDFCQAISYRYTFVYFPASETSGHLERRNRVENGPELIALHLEIEARLQIQPEAIARPEEPRQTKRRIRRDAPLPMNDLIDPPRRNTDRHGETVLGDAKRFEELLQEDFARVDSCHGLLHCQSSQC